MTSSDTCPKTYRDAVDYLVKHHGELSEFGVEIFHVPDPSESEVRLIEVSDDFPSPGPALPIPLGRSKDFPFRTSIALATHDEWAQIKRGDIEFPPDWQIDKAKKVWPRS